MKIVLALSTFFSLLPAILAQNDPTPYFTLIAARSASPIHFGSTAANGGSFWIGKPTNSYCPGEVVPDCATFPNTTVFAGGYETLSMGAVVPGGQQVYIDSSGALMFTEPHSAYVPPGSITTGFSRSEGPSFGHLSWTNGLVACGSGPWQIYAQINGVALRDDCLGFDPLTSNTTEPGTWQYI